MSTLKFERYKIPSAIMGGESSLPPIAVKLSLSDISNRFRLDESDGLFINYGIEESAFPYRSQDLYSRELYPAEYECAVLENAHLKATFFPCFGGKLWSLIDKDTGKELLFKNDVVRPCNLGVRNAWLSGGIEWNACFKGHGPFTCSPVNTARTALEDGTPVLRFYYFERIRCAVVQMDFFLPEGSKLLFARVRLTNPNAEVIPMYWWSNAGVAEKDGDRVVVPAEEAYTVNSANEVVKIGIPVFNGVDVTYPAGNITSSDFFWKTNGGRYIAQLDKTGYGICQISTSLLQGRKLFVWGNSQGGRRWMNFLTADDRSGRYDEIQSGVARTQYESLPMPPHTVWEFLEGYGAVAADPEKIFGDYAAAQRETERRINSLLPAEGLEELLVRTRKTAVSRAETVRLTDGWAQLELRRRARTGETLMCGHLAFAEIGEEQSPWLSLLENGTAGDLATEVPPSYMRQKEWLAMLAAAARGKDKDNWYAHYLLAAAYIAEERLAEAEKHLKKSLALRDTPWGNYAKAVLYRKQGKAAAEIRYMLKAYFMRAGDISLARETFRCLYENQRSAAAIRLYRGAARRVKQDNRCILYYAYALARTGKLDEADELLCGADRKTFLVVPDVRECELTVTKLWVYIRERRGLTREEMGEPPKELDFRMFSEREGWI